MGLIKAASGAIGGVLADQWREYFYCDSLMSDVLAAKGVLQTSAKSSNAAGHQNIISNGAGISVAEGQCMIIVEDGKVVELCAEPGNFTYDKSSEASLFYGKLGVKIKHTFSQMGKKFDYGRDTGKDQRVYYFNTKEIVDNKYGTPNPVPFRVVDKNIGLDIDVSVRCNGIYSYKLVDPILFYTNVCGNVTDEYRNENLDNMLRAEILTVLKPAFAQLSEMGIRYNALPRHTSELSDILKELLTQKWRNLRGIEGLSFSIISISAPPEDEQMIKQMQRNAVMRDTSAVRQQQPEAPSIEVPPMEIPPPMSVSPMDEHSLDFPPPPMQSGPELAAQLGPVIPDTEPEVAQPEPISTPILEPIPMHIPDPIAKPEPVPPVHVESIQPSPPTEWTCVCGTLNARKFCMECGTKREVPVEVKCLNCQWKPEPGVSPNFCPECGNKF